VLSARAGRARDRLREHDPREAAAGRRPASRGAARGLARHTGGSRRAPGDARLAVDAAGAGDGGRDLALRSKQRMWLAKPAQLRVEVLGFLDTTLAVLVTDGERYSLFESQEQRLQEGRSIRSCSGTRRASRSRRRRRSR
jgi:hypothetical protein